MGEDLTTKEQHKEMLGVRELLRILTVMVA